MGQLRSRAGDDNFWFAPPAAASVWYPQRFMDTVADDDPWVGWALDTVDSAMDSLRAIGYPPDRVVILGFSQGACLAAHYALSKPGRYAGLVILTGGYIGPPDRTPAFSGDFAGMPALVATVDSDAWVPLARTRETEHQLRARNAEVTSLVEPGAEHGVTKTAVDLLARMLRHFGS